MSESKIYNEPCAEEKKDSDKNSFMSKWKYSLLSKMICGENGNIMDCVSNIFKKLNDPSSYGMENTINVLIPVKTNHERIGKEERIISGWLIRPLFQNVDDLDDNKNDPKDGKEYICDQSHEIVILYLHGSGGNRSAQHRVNRYKAWQNYGVAALAIDYRGYADSSNIERVTETSMVEDSDAAMEWLQENIHPKSKIVVWGHEIGSMVCLRVGGFKNEFPAAYVLEAPFTSYTQYIHHDNKRMLWMLKYLGMDDISLSLNAADLEFDTKSRIRNINKPLFILHAEDDEKVSFEFGGKLLFQICSNFHLQFSTHQETTLVENEKSNSAALSCNVKFFPFESMEKLGHYEIHNSKMFGAILDEIILQSIKFGWQKKGYDFDAPIDIHGLNGHVFGFFNALHLMHSEKMESDISNQGSDDEKEEQNCIDCKKHMNKMVSYKNDLEQNITKLATNLANSVSSATDSVSKTVASTLKLTNAAKLM